MKSKLYRLGRLFLLREILKLSLLSIMIGYLFFDSIAAGFVIFPFMGFILVSDIKREKKRQKNELWGDYKNAVVAMTGNLGAGYSIERAFVMGLAEVAKQKGKNSLLSECVIEINNSLACSVPIENVLKDFAAKSELEDIREFSELLIAAKKYGGNIAYMARRYAKNISDRQNLQIEINTMIASKNLEGKFMIIAPFAIIIYMRLTNGGYMDILYETAFGRVVMVISLVVISVTYFVTDKIVKIEV